MSETHPTATATGRTLLDPTIPTKSLRAVLNIFGTEIVRSQAKGSIGSTSHLLRRERRSLSVDSRSGRPYWVAGE